MEKRRSKLDDEFDSMLKSILDDDSSSKAKRPSRPDTLSATQAEDGFGLKSRKSISNEAIHEALNERPPSPSASAAPFAPFNEFESEPPAALVASTPTAHPTQSPASTLTNTVVPPAQRKASVTSNFSTGGKGLFDDDDIPLDEPTGKPPMKPLATNATPSLSKPLGNTGRRSVDKFGLGDTDLAELGLLPGEQGATGSGTSSLHASLQGDNAFSSLLGKSPIEKPLERERSDLSGGGARRESKDTLGLPITPATHKTSSLDSFPIGGPKHFERKDSKESFDENFLGGTYSSGQPSSSQRRTVKFAGEDEDIFGSAQKGGYMPSFNSGPSKSESKPAKARASGGEHLDDWLKALESPNALAKSEEEIPEIHPSATQVQINVTPASTPTPVSGSLAGASLSPSPSSGPSPVHVPPTAGVTQPVIASRPSIGALQSQSQSQANGPIPIVRARSRLPASGTGGGLDLFSESALPSHRSISLAPATGPVSPSGPSSLTMPVTITEPTSFGYGGGTTNATAELFSGTSAKEVSQLREQLERAKLEKDHTEKLMEQLRRHHIQEIEMLVEGHNKRIEMIEAAANQRNEHYEQQLERMRTDRAAERAAHEKRLEEAAASKIAELEHLRQSHRSILGELDAQYKMLIEQVRSSQQTHVEQIVKQMNATDLQSLMTQMRTTSDKMNRMQSSFEQDQKTEVEKLVEQLQSKERQVRSLEASLRQKEMDLEGERVQLKHREAKYREDYEHQVLKLQEERLKAQQDQVLASSGKQQLEREQHLLTERVRREQAELDRFRDSILLEQQRITAQTQLERQLLAEERARFESERRLGTEQQQKAYIQIKQLELELQSRIQELKEQDARMQQQANSLAAREQQIEKVSASVDETRAKQHARELELGADEKQARSKLEEVQNLLEELATRKEAIVRTEEELEQHREESESRSAKLERSWKELYEREQRLLEERTELAKERREFDQLRAHGLICQQCAQPIQEAFGLIETASSVPGPVVSSNSFSPNLLLSTGTAEDLRSRTFPLPSSSVEYSLAPGSNRNSVRLGRTTSPLLALNASTSNNVSLSGSQVGALRRAAEAVVAARTVSQDMENDSALRRWMLDAERDWNYIERERAYLESLPVPSQTS